METSLDRTHVEVLRALRSTDGQLMPGDIVDASNWRLLRQLVAQRYVRVVTQPAPAAESAAPRRKSAPKETQNV